MATGVSGMYYRVYDSRTQHELVPSRFTGISTIPRVANVELVDQNDKPLSRVPSDLRTSALRFTVRGNVHGDVYRVETFPDPTIAVQEIEQIVAGKHVSIVQQFLVPLRRTARSEVKLSSYRVDRNTAERDVNVEARSNGMKTFASHPEGRQVAAGR